MSETDSTLSPLGFLHSPLKSREEAPNQGRQGAPDAWLEVTETEASGLEGIAVGDEMLLITWFHDEGHHPWRSLVALIITNSLEVMQ